MELYELQNHDTHAGTFDDRSLTTDSLCGVVIDKLLLPIRPNPVDLDQPHITCPKCKFIFNRLKRMHYI